MRIMSVLRVPRAGHLRIHRDVAGWRISITRSTITTAPTIVGTSMQDTSVVDSSRNGAFAEGRTRALLMDRFWVLERSADLEGAGLTIQRGFTNQSLLDRTPPRLGCYDGNQNRAWKN
jgi:hypothetical protein